MALLHVSYYSPVLAMDMRMDVILPENTVGQIGMDGRSTDKHCKTLYLLHGMSDDHSIWQRRTSIERYVSEKGIAVVMPTTHLGWYTDNPMGPRYFTATAIELPKICRQLFPMMSARREDTFVAGLSMGGYGALKLGLRAADTFSKVGMLSAAPDAFAVCDRRPNIGYWHDTFGEKDAIKGGFDDLFAAAKELPEAKRPPVYMWCGTEDALFPENVRMRDHLTALGYTLTWEQSPGIHHWQYWDRKIRTILDWMLPEEEDE